MKREETGGIQKRLNREKGRLHAYQLTVTGTTSFSRLLLHEFMECCITPIPGKAGSFLRSRFYPFIFDFFAKSAVTGKNISLYQPGKISVAPHVVIDDCVALNVKSNGSGIRLGERVHIGKGSILSCPGGDIIIAEGTVIGEHCRLGSLMGLQIGKRCHIGRGSYLIGAAHAYERSDIPILQQPLTCRGKTIIADDVRIGENVTIRDGVTIKKGARIADGALVLGDVAENTIMQGVPAVPVKSV